MKKFLLNNMWAFYLGFSLSRFANINLLMWEFYAILVPICLLMAIKEISK